MSRGFKMHAPLDPDCPAVREYMASWDDDPIAAHYGVDVGEFVEVWEGKHRAECARCQQYGCENIEVIGP